MAEDNKHKDFPDSIILTDELRKCRTAWMAVLVNAQRAYDELLNDRDVGEYLPDFEKLDSNWIRSFISSKVDAIMQSPNTYSAKMEAVNDWRTLEKEWLEKLKPIERLRKIDAAAKIETRGCHIVFANMDELLEEKATFVVPEWYKDYYSLVFEAYNSLSRLQEYQVKERQDSYPVQITGILKLAGRPEDFIKQILYSDGLKKFDEVQKKPSKFEMEIRAHKEELKRLQEERQKRFEEARAEKLFNGEQVDFGVSIRRAEGQLIPVGKK